MKRNLTSWYSEPLHQEMPLAAYGHFGHPVLMLPTAAADFLEYERFKLIDSVSSFVDEGKVKLYSVNSVNDRALMNRQASGHEKMMWLNANDGYITEEVLPLIRNDCNDQNIKPFITGISLGAYLACNLFFKHSDLFAGAILLSGSYDIRNFLNGHYDENVYFNNPVDYLPKLDDHYHLPALQSGEKPIIIFSGQGAFEDADRSRRLSGILDSKGIPHWLDIWGHDVKHDWEWWLKAMPHYFGKLF